MSNPSELTYEQLRDKLGILRSRLSYLISEEVQTFYKETGLVPSISVNVSKDRLFHIGSSRPVDVLNGVTVDAEVRL